MRLIEVRVVPKSSRQRVKEEGENRFKVWVHSAPEKGQANEEVRELVAGFFSVPRSKVSLLKGEHSRIKTFAIDIP